MNVIGHPPIVFLVKVTMKPSVQLVYYVFMGILTVAPGVVFF
jgi:hypothetical protein